MTIALLALHSLKCILKKDFSLFSLDAVIVKFSSLLVIQGTHLFKLEPSVWQPAVPHIPEPMAFCCFCCDAFHVIGVEHSDERWRLCE